MAKERKDDPAHHHRTFLRRQAVILRLLNDWSTTILWRSFGPLWSTRKLAKARRDKTYWRSLGAALWSGLSQGDA